jgi:hypothetical protein
MGDAFRVVWSFLDKKKEEGEGRRIKRRERKRGEKRKEKEGVVWL